MPTTTYANTTAQVDRRVAPPANIHAETTILGAILMDNYAWSEVAERLGAEDFALDCHQRIFSAMQKMFADGRTVDLITLGEQMRDCRELEAIGGLAFLASLTEGLPWRPAIGEYIDIVLEKSGLRQLAELAPKKHEHRLRASPVRGRGFGNSRADFTRNFRPKRGQLSRVVQQLACS